MTGHDAQFDALLVLSFGGPEGPDDVIPFLENVLHGRNVPRERMLEVAEHYQGLGGVSPINAQNRALIDALRSAMATGKPATNLPIYFGNRNWHPMLADALRRMVADGVERALVFITSAFGTYSGCRQYLDDIDRARGEIGDAAPVLEKLRLFYNHPGFVETMAEQVIDALDEVPVERRDAAQIVYTAHSIPESMAAGCSYTAQLADAMRLINERVGRSDAQLVYQSRSGPPGQPWLEPDVCDHLERLAGTVRDVVVVPLGFISDHVEVIFDLDREAKQACARVGIDMVRAATAGTHPRFVQMILELIEERTRPGTPRQALGALGPGPDFCPAECCPRPAPRRPGAR
ncbi:MAG: ferrochelatase [Phycisphaeraceae bacterium]|nr:ferrochelatase [Phycisphaeraceae bacterium]